MLSVHFFLNVNVRDVRVFLVTQLPINPSYFQNVWRSNAHIFYDISTALLFPSYTHIYIKSHKSYIQIYLSTDIYIYIYRERDIHSIHTKKHHYCWSYSLYHQIPYFTPIFPIISTQRVTCNIDTAPPPERCNQRHLDWTWATSEQGRSRSCYANFYICI